MARKRHACYTLHADMSHTHVWPAHGWAEHDAPGEDGPVRFATNACAECGIVRISPSHAYQRVTATFRSWFEAQFAARGHRFLSP